MRLRTITPDASTSERAVSAAAVNQSLRSRIANCQTSQAWLMSFGAYRRIPCTTCPSHRVMGRPRRSRISIAGLTPRQ
jgi:hypothetical protein